jgi:hypothetical protein
MVAKLFSIVLFFSFITLGCQSKSSQNGQNNAVSVQNRVDSVVLAKPAQLLCADILKKPSDNDDASVALDSIQLGDKHLLFLLRDSTFYVYQQKANQCELVFETHIDEDPNSWPDGDKIKLEDIDGDNQKDVFVRVYREKNYYKYCVFRIITGNDKITISKIKRLEELLNIEYDKESGLIRSNWGQKGLELDEFYKLSKDGILTFVKGTRSVMTIDKDGESDVKDTKYTTKEGW